MLGRGCKTSLYKVQIEEKVHHNYNRVDSNIVRKVGHVHNSLQKGTLGLCYLYFYNVLRDAKRQRFYTSKV